MDKCKECGQEVNSKYYEVGDHVLVKYDGFECVYIYKWDSHPELENAEVIWNKDTTNIGIKAYIHGRENTISTKFYAPPTEEQLKIWGMVIDRIDVPNVGENFTDALSIGVIICTTYDPSCSYNGLRYILKDAVSKECELVDRKVVGVDFVKNIIEVELTEEEMNSTFWAGSVKIDISGIIADNE